MLGFINAVTDKPEWTKKVRFPERKILGTAVEYHSSTQVFDESIIKKWRVEAVTEQPTGREMSERMFEYCIKELQHRAETFGESVHGAINVLPGDVYKSDTAISEELKLALQEAVRMLENVPANEKDWHPGSDGKVLDLVHPSLFPLVYGVSKILPVDAPVTTLQDCIERCGEGETLPKISDAQDDYSYSQRFQWLPCEVDVYSGKAK